MIETFTPSCFTSSISDLYLWWESRPLETPSCSNSERVCPKVSQIETPLPLLITWLRASELWRNFGDFILTGEVPSTFHLVRGRGNPEQEVIAKSAIFSGLNSFLQAERHNSEKIVVNRCIRWSSLKTRRPIGKHSRRKPVEQTQHEIQISQKPHGGDFYLSPV